MKASLTIASAVFAMTISSAAVAQSKSSIVTFHNPAGMPTPKGYSTTVQVDLGNSKMIIVSGLVAFDKNRNVVSEGDLAGQVNFIFKNLRLIAEDAGGSINDVVKLGIFLTDITGLQVVRDVRDQYVNQTNPPASTTVEVSNLVKKGLLVEIEATIIISKK